jgi:hypothetical protein
VGLWERFDDAKLIRFARRLTLKVAVPRCRRDVASPLADLLAVSVTNIKYLNAGEPSGFAGPENADIHQHRFAKAIEGKRDACHKIAGEFRGRGEQ